MLSNKYLNFWHNKKKIKKYEYQNIYQNSQNCIKYWRKNNQLINIIHNTYSFNKYTKYLSDKDSHKCMYHDIIQFVMISIHILDTSFKRVVSLSSHYDHRPNLWCSNNRRWSGMVCHTFPFNKQWIQLYYVREEQRSSSRSKCGKQVRMLFVLFFIFFLFIPYRPIQFYILQSSSL